MKLTGYNFIGKRSSSEGMITFKSIDPETGIHGSTSFYEATRDEVNKAVEKAVSAFQEYKSISNESRAHFLESIAEEILELGDDLLNLCNFETAFPEGRLKGERGRTVNQLRLFAEVVREGSWKGVRIDTADENRQPVEKPDIRQIQIPLGPVGIFGASNFPLAFSVAGGDTASALAAGCPVVVKGHPLHPGTSEMIATAILSAAKKCKMPDGVFSLLQGKSNEVGMAIVESPNITAIAFTGSFGGGKAIFDAANKRYTPIPVFAEMGSINPVFILPQALKERKVEIAKGLISSLNMGVGQFCTNPGLIVTNDSDDSADLLESLSAEIKVVSSGVMLGENIKREYEKGVSRLRDFENVLFVNQGEISKGDNAVRAHLFSTDAHTFSTHPALSHEVFGPSTIHVFANRKYQILELAEKLEGHLTATLIATDSDLEEYQDLIAILERKVGRIIFNGYPTGVEVCHAMVHGGPFPATTSSQSTSVGTSAIMRFVRPVCYQDFPSERLPIELRNENKLGIFRMINGLWTKDKI